MRWCTSKAVRRKTQRAKNQIRINSLGTQWFECTMHACCQRLAVRSVSEHRRGNELYGHKRSRQHCHLINSIMAQIKYDMLLVLSRLFCCFSFHLNCDGGKWMELSVCRSCKGYTFSVHATNVRRIFDLVFISFWSNLGNACQCAGSVNWSEADTHQSFHLI